MSIFKLVCVLFLSLFYKNYNNNYNNYNTYNSNSYLNFYKHENRGKILKSHIINLDLPPEDRWNKVLEIYKNPMKETEKLVFRSLRHAKTLALAVLHTHFVRRRQKIRPRPTAPVTMPDLRHQRV